MVQENTRNCVLCIAKAGGLRELGELSKLWCLGRVVKLVTSWINSMFYASIVCQGLRQSLARYSIYNPYPSVQKGTTQ